MKQRILLLAVIGLALIVAYVLPATASNTTDALYRGTVVVTNNSTAASRVATVFTGNVTAWADVGYMNTSGNNTAIVSASGADLAYMPGYAGNVWALWVPSIGGNANLNDILYMGGATDMAGDIRYFPDSAGMDVADNATLEVGDNFTITYAGYVDTTTDGVGGGLFGKEGAFVALVDSVGSVGICVSDNESSSGWVTPTGFTDSGSDWTNETNAYDDNLATYATTTHSVQEWSDYLELSHGEMWTREIRYYIVDPGSNQFTLIDIDGYYSGGWHDVYQGAWTESAYTAVTMGAPYLVSNIRIRAYHDDVVGHDLQVYEMDYGIPPAMISAAVSSGEYIIAGSADGTDISISIDGSVEDTETLGGASVNNTAFQWNFCQGNAAPYVEYIAFTIGGAATANWSWEYSDTFTDSISAIAGTPTFRGTSSDADVSANLTLFAPITEADAPAYTLSDAPDFITTTPDMSGNFSAATVNATYPGSNIITSIAVASDTPEQLPTILMFTSILVIISLTVSAIFRNNGTGTINAKAGIVIGIMFIYVALGIYDVWQVYFFGLIALGTMWLSRQREAY